MLAVSLLAGALLFTLLTNSSGTLAAGNAYTIDVNDYSGSLSVPGPGYSYDSANNVLIFNTAANGNTYTIKRTAGGAGPLSGITFLPGSSPASVTIVGLYSLSKGITLPSDFSADMAFKPYTGDGTYATLGAALTLPTGYKGNLDISGLKVDTLTFPSDYDLPIVFNGLEISTALNYPTGYSLPITIGGPFIVPAAQQFPSGYAGEIIIGHTGGEFTNQQTVCRPGAGIGFDNGIFLPNSYSSLTINNAQTGGSGHLNIRLGASDTLKLLLAGDSNIKGYIEVPANAALTIDSKEDPGSESGRLAVTADSNAAIGSNSSAGNGTITINGGTVEATGRDAGIGGGSGQITVNNGKVVAACTGGSGAGIGSGAGYAVETIAHITINGGTVTASANGDGAGVGSASGATGGYPNNYTSVGAVIKINGGTVVANGGDVDHIYLGSGAYSGAGIGGGKDACADITITGGHITANSMHGAGIGNGKGSLNAVAVRGNIVITGGTIRGYTMDGASIGAGHSDGNFVNQISYRPTYLINKEADVLMHRRGHYNDEGSLIGDCGNPNGNVGANGYNGDSHGDGYLVNLFWWDNVYGDLYVYKADTGAFVRRLPIPAEHPYGAILFSTGHSEPENFRIFVDRLDHNGDSLGMKQVVHYYDHLPSGSFLQLKHSSIPSITHMESYPHNFDNATWDTLFVAFDDGQGSDTYYKVTERYSDINGSPISNDSGKKYKERFIKAGTNYTGPHEAITDYIYKGYKLNTPPANSSDYSPGEPDVRNVSGDILVYFVYSRDYTVTEKYVDIDGQTLAQDTETIVAGTAPSYTKTIPPIKDYTILGYFIGDPFEGVYTPGAAVTNYTVTEDTIIYFVYQEVGVTTLTITKTVAGEYGDRTKEFNFTVTFTDSDGDPLPSGPFSTPVEFKLKHGESHIIEDVPLNLKVQVEEAEDTSYSVTFVDSETPGGAPESGRTTGAPRAMTEDRVFTFINTRVMAPETGISLGSVSAIFLLPLLIIAAALLCLAARKALRRRRENA